MVAAFFTYSHDHSIAAVANGLVDGAAVYSTTYEKLESEADPLLAQVKVIARGAFVGNQPIVVRPQLTSTEKAELKAVLLHLHESERGRAVLEQLNYDYFIEADDRYFSPSLIRIRELDESK